MPGSLGAKCCWIGKTDGSVAYREVLSAAAGGATQDFALDSALSGGNCLLARSWFCAVKAPRSGSTGLPTAYLSLISSPWTDVPQPAGRDASRDRREWLPLSAGGGPSPAAFGIAWALRHAGAVVAATLAPIGATPFAGLISWLGSLRPRLQKSVAEHVATDEERQVLHLIEFAASRFGDPLLRATSVDDFDDRLDALTDSPEALHCTELLALHMPLVQASLPMSATLLAAAAGHSLEEAQGQVSKDPQRILEAWLDAQRQAAQLMWSTDAPPVSEASFRGTDPPIEIEKLIFHGLRANFCGLAIEQVFSAGRLIPAWLAGALADRLVVSARQHVRLLASLPGVSVDKAIVPDAERLDFVAIEARHQRAKAASQRSYERARARLGP